MSPAPEALNERVYMDLYRQREAYPDVMTNWVGGVMNYNEMRIKEEILLAPGSHEVGIVLGGEELNVSLVSPTLVTGMDTTDLVSWLPRRENDLSRFNKELGSIYGLRGKNNQYFGILTVHESESLNHRERNVWLHTVKTKHCDGARRKSGQGVIFSPVVGKLFGAMCLAEEETFSSIRGGGGRVFMVRGKEASDVVVAIPGHMIGGHESDERYFPVSNEGLNGVKEVITRCSKAGLVTGVIGIE
jgi:hypothetical protein